MKSHSLLGRTLSAAALGAALAGGWIAGAQAAGSPAAAPAVMPAAAQLGPEQIVKESATRMLTELSAHRSMYAKDPAKLDQLVANVLLPNFDTEYSAQLVLGPTWRKATPEQRKRFVAAFYHSLLGNYGAALIDFTANRFHILPFRGNPNGTEATVRTYVTRENGEKVPVDFRLHKTPTGWKAWDVVIEGVSYVQSFRTDFASEIDQKGLQEVIDRLERQNAAALKGTAKGHPRSGRG
ncbi:MAG TPA: ABC transporter substrate-binding protein [Steroidobacteraceae bacterium]|nr:ABC transporter substrate-binding protein [Steroidobacteraceae bacterium]